MHRATNGRRAVYETKSRPKAHGTVRYASLICFIVLYIVFFLIQFVGFMSIIAYCTVVLIFAKHTKTNDSF